MSIYDTPKIKAHREAVKVALTKEPIDAVERGVISELEGRIVTAIMTHTGCSQEQAIDALTDITAIPELNDRLSLQPIAPMPTRR